MTIKVTYDSEADAAWIRIGEGQSVETAQAGASVNLDFDADGQLLAIEVLDASKTAPALIHAGKSGVAIAAE